ncbi:MAG: DUF2334 domain-containing protein [Butyrivibrio sp.]|nr:DUF2334 domain-containing protein [Butyrivibrio sp.]
MNIAIRMDDITPDMDWEKFYRFKALLDKYGCRPLIGVVPDNRDKKLAISDKREDFFAYIRELVSDGWIVAMHGYNHLYTTEDPGLFPIGHKSEFAGQALVRQNEMIRKGRDIFEANRINTDIFMAPSHSFDKNTLLALRQNGFHIITDGFGTGPFKSNGFVFYPISVQKSRTLKDMRDGLVTFVYHANTMDDSDFMKLEELLKSGKVVSYSEFSRFPVEERTFVADAWQFVLATAKRIMVQLRS